MHPLSEIATAIKFIEKLFFCFESEVRLWRKKHKKNFAELKKVVCLQPLKTRGFLVVSSKFFLVVFLERKK